MAAGDKSENMMELSQPHAYSQDIGFFKRLSVLDWIYAAALLAASLFALNRYGSHMDYYEKAVLVLAAPTFAWRCWRCRPSPCTAATSMSPTRNFSSNISSPANPRSCG